jgi:hypothetical protein
MTKKEAFKKCKELNPPLYPPKPMPFAVRFNGTDYEVVNISEFPKWNENK